jgi:hypothetical protein
LRCGTPAGKPSAGAWATIQNFDGRYRELRPALATELHRLLEPWHREFFTGARPLEESELLLERFELESIEVDPPEVKVLAFSLKEGWDDALFRVSVDGWTPRAVAVED